MEIDSSLVNSNGERLKVFYKDIDAVEQLEGRAVSGVHAYCFHNDKLVIVYAEKRGTWTPAGGGVEAGETVEEAVIREVLEESNMKVLKHALLGFQDISEPQGVVTQTRSVCIVEPYGEFVSDPDEDITEIRMIDVAEYKDYFDWGIVGDHLMSRALELKNALMQ
jgi:ADP-ribose pyrophosphatase YjhB (NUDIX family)